MLNQTNVIKTLGLSLAALLLAACASTTLPPDVMLVGDVYYIPNEGVEVNGRSGFRLKPASYRFATEKAGHQLKVHDVDIENREGRLIRVEPGRGFAVAEFTFTPDADTAIVANAASPDEARRNLQPPWRVELDAGPYRVEAHADGFWPLAEEFEVLPNQPVFLDLHFVPKPTSAPLLITTTPAGAELVLDGVPVGAAPKNLDTVEFGAHRIDAYVYRDSDNRVAFEGGLAFGEDSPGTLELILDIEQRRFEGEWYERSEAERLQARKRVRERRAEERRYREARTEDPLEIRLQLATLADKDVTTVEDFAQALFRLLRVGDRLRVDFDGRDHLVWKRSDQIDAAFRRQVAALWHDQPIRIDYDEDPARVIEVNPGSSLITTVAYRLYRRVNDHPILDLGAAMHDLNGISVHTLAEDGGVTVLTFGGKNVLLNGHAVEATRQLGFVRLEAGDRELNLKWEKAPQRVLVVSEKNTAAQPVLADGELNLHQKRLIELGVGGRVRSFHRFTKYPDGTWRHVASERVGPLAASMDLNTDEAGPHAVSGAYRREWLIDYETHRGLRATRQVAADYKVGDKAHPVEASDFLRREAP